MSRLRIPNFLYSRTAHLVDAFCEVADLHGFSREEAERLFRILPLEIKSAQTFFCTIGNRWRYDYGEEIDRLPGDQVVLGTHNCPEVGHLFLGLRAIASCFTDTELKTYIERLSPRAKHHEVLFELAPLIRISEGVTAKFEVAGLGPGNTTVDWLFTSPQAASPVALEVKYRYKDLVGHLEEMAPGVIGVEPEVRAGPADPAVLFKSLAKKFNPTDPRVRLQGGWIHAIIKVRRHELDKVFSGLDQERLHFAILNAWGPEAYLVARPDVDVDYLASLFALERSENFVVDEVASS